MSLLDEALSQNRRNKVADDIRKRVKEGTETINKIWDGPTFVEVAKNVCGKNVLEPDEIEKCDGFRTRVRIYWTSISSLMPSSDPKEPRGVTKETWARMIASAIEGHLAQIKLSGFNGAWHLMEYQAEIVNDNRIGGGIPCFVLVCKYVDIHGQQDLTFRRGRPQMDEVMGSNISKADLANLIGAMQEGADERMTKLLEPLVELLADKKEEEVQEVVDGEPEPEKKPVRRRRRTSTPKA